MGTLYLAVPKSSHAPAEVATSTARKTLLQVATPSTTDIRVKAWGVSFDGVVVTNPPGIVDLIDVDVAATVTTLTPEEWESDDGQASLCVGGASATGYNATAEGAITASRILDSQEVHPQNGYAVWFPNKGPRIKPSRFLRIRALFSVDINGIPWIVWEEPA